MLDTNFQMKFTLTINELDKHTIALLNLIKATSNVSLREETDDFTLSDEHQEILEKRYDSHQKGESNSALWQDVKSKCY